MTRKAYDKWLKIMVSGCFSLLIIAMVMTSTLMHTDFGTLRWCHDGHHGQHCHWHYHEPHIH